MKKPYCTQNAGQCESCALSSYNRDCRNNPVGGTKPDLSIDIDGTPYVSYKQAAGMIGIKPASVCQLVHTKTLDGGGGYVTLDSVEAHIKNKMTRTATKRTPVD